MNRRSILIFALLFTFLFLFSCSSKKENTLEKIEEESVLAEKPTEVEPQKINGEEFLELLQKEPVAVDSAKVIVQPEELKESYPDVIQIVLKNNSQYDIENVSVLVVGWDEKGDPAPIKDNDIIQMNYHHVNMIPDGVFGQSGGFALDKDSPVKTVVAIVSEFTTFGGDHWKSPYVDLFKQFFELKKYDLQQEHISDTVQEPFKGTYSAFMTPQEYEEKEDQLAESLKEQPARVMETNYIVQSESYRHMYPDQLEIKVLNALEIPISSFTLGIVGWDQNNLPVIIKEFEQENPKEYVFQKKMELELGPDQISGTESKVDITLDTDVKYFKAIVLSTVDAQGNTWKNPLEEEFRNLYEGKKRLTLKKEHPKVELQVTPEEESEDNSEYYEEETESTSE